MLRAGDEQAHNFFQYLVSVAVKTKLFEQTLVGRDGDGEGAVFFQFSIDLRNCRAGILGIGIVSGFGAKTALVARGDHGGGDKKSSR